MDCPSCREVVSAGLDGEALPEEVVAAEHHLASCASCAEHRDAVTRLHRAVRIVPAEDVPDLTASILARATPPEPVAPAGHDDVVWRVGLAAVAVAQLVAAVAHLSDDHLARDQASWEAAVATGFAWAAWRPTRTAGLLPVAVVLTALLLLNGGLGLAGSGTHHLLAPLGLVLLLLATRAGARSSEVRAA